MRRRLYIATLWVFWLGIVIFLVFHGRDYYSLPVVERPHAPGHSQLKPGGLVGHGLGIVGSLLMIFGVMMYSMRKRMRRLMGWGNLRNWLAFHIFLCVTGATLVTFHTAFKFGGLVSMSFWCMVGVAFSGVLGRYVYVRIPRDIRGNELSAAALQSDYDAVARQLREVYVLPVEVIQRIDVLFAFHTSEDIQTGSRNIFRMVFEDGLRIWRRHQVRQLLQVGGQLPTQSVREVMRLVKQRATLVRSIQFYSTVRRILHYWHVIHLPFTVVMFLIMFVHVITAILFGYRWVF